MHDLALDFSCRYEHQYWCADIIYTYLTYIAASRLNVNDVVYYFVTHKMFLLSDMDECVIDIFRPLPVVINDVYKSFFDSVYDRIRVF